MRHEGMEQSQYGREHNIHYRQGRSLFRFVSAKNVSFGCFNKPVAVIAPNKIIETLCDQTKLILAIRGVDCLNGVIQPHENFYGILRQLLLFDNRRRIACTVHLTKACDVPEFRRNVTAFLDLSFIEAYILSRWRDLHQSKS